jgi:hypothetical protein
MQLELVRGITEQGAPIRMPARGFSMWPFIRDQDILVMIIIILFQQQIINHL